MDEVQISVTEQEPSIDLKIITEELPLIEEPAVITEVVENDTKRKADELPIEEPVATTLEIKEPEAKKVKLSTASAPPAAADSTDKIKKSKVALLLTYSGAGYSGKLSLFNSSGMQSQKNSADTLTIEKDLHSAFEKSGVVSFANADDPKKYNFVRACRTDKGVSASGNVVSLKALMIPNIVEKLNEHLPEQIRVLGINLMSKFKLASLHWEGFTHSITPTLDFMNILCRLMRLWRLIRCYIPRQIYPLAEK